MNKQRRKEIADISAQIEDLIQQAESLKDAIEVIRDDEQDYYDNMPESFQMAERGQAAEEAVSNLGDALSSLEDFIGSDVVSLLEDAAN